MSILQDDIRVMNQAGLTIMQAKIYLALLKLDKGTIKEIAKVAKIDQSNCYRTISFLQKSGLVTRILNRPNRYLATPFKECVSILLEQQKIKYDEIQKATANLAQRLTQKEIQDKVTKEEKFTIIPKKTMFLNQTVSNIRNAQTSINCITNLKRLSQAMVYSFEAHRTALNRGVLERTIIDKPKKGQKFSESLQTLMAYPNFQVRYLLNTPEALGAAIDNKHVGILVEPNQSVTESSLLSSKHPSLITIFNEYFTNLWNTAIDVKKTKT